MIQNPILRGFCPDPSIIRVGEDYYIATSTFEWWPGVKIFHSKDLNNWEQLKSPLRRKSQLNLQGDPTSGGIWAPCLSYDGTYFYLVYTDVKTKKGRFYNTHNYLVYTKDICGEWSEPIYLNSIGFDPSLFHDTNGRKYLVNMVNGFKGILLQELDIESGKLIGERKKIYDGSGIGCTEGPHLYHIGKWYYLITAEGGTGYEHCVSIARSENIWGPYETAPNNPILTSNQQDAEALQKCGHADMVETQDGEWYMVHLCARPVPGTQWCTLGRETAIQKLVWTGDGWPKLCNEGRFAQWVTPSMKEDNIQELGHEAGAEKEVSFFDDFEKGTLDVRYSTPREAMEEFADCTIRKGYVRLKGRESMNSLHRVSLLAVRQQRFTCSAETAMEFVPQYSEQMAGIAYMYDAMNFYLFTKTLDDEGNAVLVLLKSDAGVITDEIQPVKIPLEEEVKLRIHVVQEGRMVQFMYQLNNRWISIPEVYTTQLVSDEYCRGFTGAHFGLYVHDLIGLSCHADFDYFKVGE